jgi:hypothetical protein
VVNENGMILIKTPERCISDLFRTIYLLFRQNDNKATSGVGIKIKN